MKKKSKVKADFSQISLVESIIVNYFDFSGILSYGFDQKIALLEGSPWHPRMGPNRSRSPTVSWGGGARWPHERNMANISAVCGPFFKILLSGESF